MMNPRRVHELMTANFPQVDLSQHTWVNILERDGTVRSQVLAALLDKFVSGEDLLVEVSRKVGDLLPRENVILFVEANVGRGQIRIADRAFQGYVLVGANGVATGWSSSEPRACRKSPLSSADSPADDRFGWIADVNDYSAGSKFTAVFAAGV